MTSVSQLLLAKYWSIFTDIVSNLPISNQFSVPFYPGLPWLPGPGIIPLGSHQVTAAFADCLVNQSVTPVNLSGTSK